MSLTPAAVPLALYVHWPWCVQKCPYCDFNSHVLRAVDEEAYVRALLDDWRAQLPWVQGREIVSVFFGGGTPSLARPEWIARLLSQVADDVTLAQRCEITLEANPGTADAAHFAGYRAAGVNRLSLGVQSFDDGLLSAIGRIHDGAQALAAVALARVAGFDNINLDLMVGLPGQNEALAVADVRQALALAPEHVSHYQLTLEPNTPFYARPPVNLPDDDLADVLQLAGHAVLAEAGFGRYEVSAWARDPGCESRHNRNYWQFGDYVGLGAGAHGKLTLPEGVIRTSHAKSPGRYVADVQAGRGPFVTEVAPAQLPFEFLLNALRLREGVASELFVARTGLPLSALEPQWSRALAEGYVVPLSERLATTEQGYAYLNRVLSDWV